MIRCFLHDLPHGQIVYASRADNGDIAIIADRAAMMAMSMDGRWAIHNAILDALDSLPTPATTTPITTATTPAVIHLNDFRPSQSPTVRAI